MGDGIEPLIRGPIGIIGAGLAGIVHGALDSTEYSKELSPLVHEALTYVPFIGAGLFTAASRYGLWTPGSKVGAFAIVSPIASLFEGAGYLVGKVLGYGTQRVLEL